MAKEKSKDAKQSGADFTVALNRRGRYNYEIEESMEAGLVLTGTEVKSARASQVQIAEAFARVEEGASSKSGSSKAESGKKGAAKKANRGRARQTEVWVHGMFIGPYEQGGAANVDSRRKRKLLLHRAQIDRLAGRIAQKGYSLIPLKLYFTDGRAKLELGIGKGRKTHDKRRAITERETKRDVSRNLSR